jgi:hypothetical protein
MRVRFDIRDSTRRKSIMTRVAALLFMLLLAACSDQKSPPEAVNDMIESPLRSTVISSGDHYPPEPIIITGSINAQRAVDRCTADVELAGDLRCSPALSFERSNPDAIH